MLLANPALRLHRWHALTMFNLPEVNNPYGRFRARLRDRFKARLGHGPEPARLSSRLDLARVSTTRARARHTRHTRTPRTVPARSLAAGH